MTQCQRVMQFLKDNKTITQMQALRELSVMRLPSRINDLRKAGNLILTEREHGMNQFGDQTSYARYRLIKEA